MQMQLNRRMFANSLLAAWLAARYALTEGEAMAAKATSPQFLSEANNRFAVDLLKSLNQAQPANNHFLSPFSIESALTIALEGARQQTARQMGEALRYPAGLRAPGDQPWDMASVRGEYARMLAGLQPTGGAAASKTRDQLKDWRKQLATLNADARNLMTQNKFAESQKLGEKASELAERINKLAPTVDQFELAIANSLWVDTSYPLSKAYQQIVSNSYGSAAAIACDFQRKADQERERINQWVAEHTQDKIKDIIQPGTLSPETRLVIANAIYFKGNGPIPSVRLALNPVRSP